MYVPSVTNVCGSSDFFRKWYFTHCWSFWNFGRVPKFLQEQKLWPKSINFEMYSHFWSKNVWIGTKICADINLMRKDDHFIIWVTNCLLSSDNFVQVVVIIIILLYLENFGIVYLHGFSDCTLLGVPWLSGHASHCQPRMSCCLVLS